MHPKQLIVGFALLGTLWDPSQAADTDIAVQYRDKPHVVLIGAHAADRARVARTLKDLFANPELKLGKVSGASYGSELDNRIGATTQVVVDSTVTPLSLARMVKFKRADYMLIDEEDYTFLNQQGEVDATPVKAVQYADMPPGLKRHIMCSKNVGANTMERINTAIRQLALPIKS